MRTRPRIWLLREGTPWRVMLVAAMLSPLGACSTTDWQARAVSMPMGADVQGTAAPAYQRGKAHLTAGHFGLALEAFREAKRADPDSIASLNAVAITYGKLGRLDTARRYFERALAIEPRSPQTLNNFGRALLEQGRAGEALELFQRATELEADNPTIAANLAVAQRRLDERDARVRNARAAGSDPDGTAPTTWIERSSPRLQTLVTEASAPAPAAEAGAIDPRLVHVVDGRASARDIDGRKAPQFSGPRLEVSNGAGRRHMAARMRRYLGEQGLSVDRLTNADWFGYRQSAIFYRPGFKAEALRLARLMQLDLSLEESPKQRSAVRLRLGADLLDFDATLPRQS